MSESELQREIMLVVPEVDSRLFRNNVGAWEWAPGKWLHYGLCDGSGDLIGWQTVTITPEMVGRRIGVFISIEVKPPGPDKTQKKRKAMQANWREQVNAAGGIGIVARSIQDVIDALMSVK